MAKLSISSRLQSVVVVGEFCNWDVNKAIRADSEKGKRTIVIEDMPTGEYRVLSCKSYTGGEVYPTDGRQMANRYFSGKQDEKIYCYF